MADDDTGQGPEEGFDGRPLPEVGGAAPGGAPPPPPAAAGGDLPPEVLQVLHDAGVRPIPGETQDAALLRANAHLVGRMKGIDRDRKGFREELQTLKNSLEPLLREQYRELQAKQAQQWAHSVPDRELQPAEYAVWMLEQQEARTQAAAAGQQEAADVEAMNTVDSYAIGELATALGIGSHEGQGADAEAVEAYRSFVGLNLAQIELAFPGSEQEEREELARLTQQSLFREIVQGGGSVVATLKQLNQRARGIWGGAAAPAQARQPAARSNIARVEQAAQRAQARGPVSRPAGARGGQIAGEPIDLAAIDEDEFVRLSLSGQLTNAMVQRHVGRVVPT